MCILCVQGMLSELQTEMELHYMEDKNLKPVKEPVVGEIYVASHEESWHRVELLEVMGEYCEWGCWKHFNPLKSVVV